MEVILSIMISYFKNILILVFAIFIMGFVAAEQINLSQWNMEDKVRQTVIVSAESYNNLKNKNMGGIFFSTAKQLNSAEEYKDMINDLQKQSSIKLFVSADLEGYWNPFSKFYDGKIFGEIKNGEEAYEIGIEHGKLLKEIGFNLDFSPVVETRNNVWPGRSFSGSEEEIKEKIKYYIRGLQENDILATAKHYPGGSMIKNPHWKKYKTEIFPEDLKLFDYTIRQNIDAVMVGHPIVYGAINSGGKQSSVSPSVIANLRKNFNGLIISDAITMLGLRVSYLGKFNYIYIDLIKAGNDIILDVPFSIFVSGADSIEKRVKITAKAAENDVILQKRIDESVERILKVKGYSVVY